MIHHLRRTPFMVTVVALALGAFFVPTVVRMFRAPPVELLDFAPMEAQLEEILTTAMSTDSTVPDRIELSEQAVRSESLVTVGAIDRWSFTGQQMAELGHRLRRTDVAQTAMGGGVNADWITTDLLTVERVRGRQAGQMEIQLNRGAYNIPSPFIDFQRNVVLSRDARDGRALVRDGSVDYFESPERIPIPETFPPGWCAAVRWSPVSVGVRCGTAAGGLGSDRFAEFRLLVEPDTERDIPRLVAAARRGVRVDGIDAYPDTIPLRPGRLVRSQGLDGAFISRARTGTVVDAQTVNGRSRLMVTSERYGQIGMALGAIRRPEGGYSPIPLSVSPRLTQQLDSLVRAVVDRANRRGADRDFNVTRAEVVAIDLGTGDILALSSSREPGVGAFLPGTQVQWLGSAVKPMVAAAVLSAHPSLTSLVITSGEDATIVDGRPLRRPFNAGCDGGTVDLRRAMRCSSNIFSAELLVRGIRLSGVPRDRRDTTRYEPGALAVSPVLEAMADLWQTPLDARGGEPSTEVWERNDREGVGARFVKGHGGLLPQRSAPQFLSRRTTAGVPEVIGPTLDQTARIAYGQAWNEWTLLDAAAVFGRVVTGRDLQKRFLRYEDSTASGVAFPWRGSAWHRVLLAGLTDVVRQPEGTAAEVGARVEYLLGRPVRLVGKTGSPDLDGDDFLERNTFVGAISLRAGAPEDPLTDGIAYALFVDYQDPKRARDREGATVARRQLRVHRELAAEVAYVLGRYLQSR